MKRIRIIFIVILTFLCFIPLFKVNAFTVKDLRQDLADLKKEKAEANANRAKTEAEIAAANKEIDSITSKMEQANIDQENLSEEIEKLEGEIDTKEEQIKELVSFLQISNSENFYLKYLFGATDFTDFIYRFSVIEQVTTRSDELVDEMNDLITKNKAKIKELETKKKELEGLQQEVQNKLASLSKEKTKFTDMAYTIDDEIKVLQGQIDIYVNAGCNESIDVSLCTSSVPFDFGFNRPLTRGYVTDEMGMRKHPTTGVWKMHNGIDLGGNSEGTVFYAPAAGKVVSRDRISCGGNTLTINHIVNGRAYTTRYYHVLSYNVSVGQIIAKGQNIGRIGGGRQTYSYDKCSTGAHLHFEMANGHYLGSGSDAYYSYSTYLQRVFNPRQLVYFPAYGVRW